jgi:predicted PurR-regulated permease PerM
MLNSKINPSHNPRAARPVWVYPLMTIFLWSVGLVLLLKFFEPIKLILLGLLGSCSVAAMLRPVANRIRGPRGLSAIIVGLGFLVVTGGVLTSMSWLLLSPLKSQLDNWPQMRDSLDRLLNEWSQKLGAGPANLGSVGNQLSDLVTGHNIADLVSKTADMTTLILLASMFVFVGSIYILAEPPGRLVRPVLKILPPWRVAPMRAAMADLEPRLRWWMIGTLVGMAVVGIASFVGYTLVGIKWALPLAVFAGVSEAVPTIGPAATFVLALLLAATQGAGQMIGVAIVYGAIQTLESYVLIPVVMKSAVNVPPLVSLFTIVLWGKIFGLAGLLLAVPIDLVIWALIDHMVIRPDDTG